MNAGWLIASFVIVHQSRVAAIARPGLKRSYGPIKPARRDRDVSQRTNAQRSQQGSSGADRSRDSQRDSRERLMSPNTASLPSRTPRTEAAKAYHPRLSEQILLDDERLCRLRPGQRGAIFAMRSWATAPDDGVAILGLPTGYGKSELIALAPFLFSSRRTLVIAPSVVVRHQLAERIRAQEHLRKVGIIPDALPLPRVREHVGRIDTPSGWEDFQAFDVVVSHTQSVSPEGKVVVDPPDPDLFDLILFDEAHHLGAPSWVAVRAAFPAAAAVGFTATPYRRDRRALPGRVIFQYPIDKAVDEGFFVPITYREVSATAATESRDTAVATEAIAELRRRNDAAGVAAARLLVRADTVKRATELADLYHRLDPDVKLEVITHETSPRQLDVATDRLKSGLSSGVAFVGVLGEGFDLPSLKIAAYHNPHRSLPVTIQFAGRVARTEQQGGPLPGAEEHAVLIATVDDHPEILAELHRDGQRWDRLIPTLARELGEGVVKTWAMFSPDTADMAAAFTAENFRTFILADVYKLPSRPADKTLGERLASLHVVIPAPAQHNGRGREADDGSPRDIAVSVKVLREADCYAVLFAREHDVQWLEATPRGHVDYEYLVLALVRHRCEDSWWLCVRSTLPGDMTARALQQLFGQNLERPLRSQLALYRGDSWPGARFTGLGKRAIHPVVAGVMSYETGAGRHVDQALTLDDRALHEAGHAIGVVAAAPGTSDVVQIGIAMNKRRVWQVGYARLSEYLLWATRLCRDLESGSSVTHLGGLRVADGPLDPKAKPVAAMLDPLFDSAWNAEYSDGATSVTFHKLELRPMARPHGADVRVRLMAGGTAATTIVYSPDGRLLSAPGDVLLYGRREPLKDRLESRPLAVFFDNGAVMRGAGGCVAPATDSDAYFPVSERPRKVDRNVTAIDSTNRFAVLDRQITLLPEKDGTRMATILGGLARVTRSTRPESLFQFAVRQARTEHADFVFCDDARNEIADFIIGWRSHPVSERPHVRLIHCKAMTAAERERVAGGGQGIRDSGLKEVEEISQQTLRCISFLLLPQDLMLRRLDDRSHAYPARYVIGTRDTFDAIVSREPLTRTADIWMVHPGLSHARVVGAAGAPVTALLSSVRARAIDARADLAVLGRA